MSLSVLLEGQSYEDRDLSDTSLIGTHGSPDDAEHKELHLVYSGYSVSQENKKGMSHTEPTVTPGNTHGARGTYHIRINVGLRRQSALRIPTDTYPCAIPASMETVQGRELDRPPQLHRGPTETP